VPLSPLPAPSTAQSLTVGAYPFPSDEIYTQSWHDALQECEKTLERHDRERALHVQSLQHFRDELESLLTEYPDEQSRKAIMRIHPTLDHYETFAQNFVSMMAHPVDMAMMWGLLFLVFKASCTLQGALPDLY
jgi:hypothetical protein